MNTKPLTVKELKELLQNAPDDGIVYISGTGLGHVDVVYNHDNHVVIKKNERKTRNDDFHGVFLNIVPSAESDATVPFVENNIMERMYYRSYEPSYPFVFRLINSLLGSLLYKMDADNQSFKRYEDRWRDERSNLDSAVFKTFIKMLIQTLSDAEANPNTLKFPYDEQIKKFEPFSHIYLAGSAIPESDKVATTSLKFKDVEILEDGTFDMKQFLEVAKQ